MVSAQQERSETKLGTKQIPGAFQQPNAQEIARLLESLSGVRGESPFAEPLLDVLTGPFDPTTSEQGVIENVLSQSQAGSAVRGLGQLTPEGVSSSIAPTVIGLQGEKAGQLITALGQDLGQQEALRGINVEGLLRALEAELPQIVAGTRGESKGTSGSISSSLIGLAGSGGGGGGGTTVASRGSFRAPAEGGSAFA